MLENWLREEKSESQYSFRGKKRQSIITGLNLQTGWIMVTSLRKLLILDRWIFPELTLLYMSTAPLHENVAIHNHYFQNIFWQKYVSSVLIAPTSMNSNTITENKPQKEKISRKGGCFRDTNLPLEQQVHNREREWQPGAQIDFNWEIKELLPKICLTEAFTKGQKQSPGLRQKHSFTSGSTFVPFNSPRDGILLVDNWSTDMSWTSYFFKY